MENRIRKALQEHRIYASVWTENNGNIAVEIEWGDWKHEHLATDIIVERLGGEKVREKTTEEDGSDTYSSIHYFHFG